MSIVVQLPPDELDRMLRESAEQGAALALSQLGERLDRVLGAVETGTHRDLLNTEQAASLAGLTGQHRRKTVARWVREEGLPSTPHPTSGEHLIWRDDLTSWLGGRDRARRGERE